MNRHFFDTYNRQNTIKGGHHGYSFIILLSILSIIILLSRLKPVYICWTILGIIALYIMLWQDNHINIYGGVDDIDATKSNEHMKMDLMDPKHNLREIAKQLILLEDHMAHKSKRCVDCITKHYLMVEALLEEAITLDKTGEHIEEIRHILDTIKPTMMDVIKRIKTNNYDDDMYNKACQTLRIIRKDIANKYVLNN